jgi:Rod binding domain-containing protein
MNVATVSPDLSAARPARLPAGAADAPVASGGRDGDWEFMLQNGRVPTSGAQGRGFLRYLCRQLEATAINTMLQAARRASPGTGLLSGGFAGSIYQSLADQEYARMLAERGGFGLGDQIYNQMAAKLEAEKAYRQAPAARPNAGIGPKGVPDKSDN